MQLALSQRNLDEGSNPSFCAGRKLGEVEQALLWNLLHEDSSSPSRVLLDKVAHMQRPIAVSIRHLNRWRVTRGSIGARAARIKLKAIGLLPLAQRWSG